MISFLRGAANRGATPDDEDGRTDRMSRLLGVFVASIWLVWLISPLVHAAELLGKPQGDVGFAAVLGFAVVYVWQFSRRGYVMGGADVVASPSARLQGWLGYVAMAALAVVCLAMLGQSGTTPFVFLAIAGMWTMPMVWAFAVAVALAVAYAAAWTVVPGWTEDLGTLTGMAMGVVAVGVAVISARRQRALGRARRENARLMVEEERTRFARDLHDILGHSLTVITVKAELARRVMDADPGRARSELEDLERLSRDALADVRRAVDGYREISLPGELARARAALAATGIEADIPRATDEVPSAARELFAWTVREGVTNVLRHSQARRCEILLGPTSVTIADDGGGDAPSAASPPQTAGGTTAGVVAGGASPVAAPTAGDGHGLRGLRERARALGATVETGPGPLDGFAVTVRLSPRTAGRAGAAQ
ncbi:histidine kinase [Sinomonas sp. ASV486]|uniref:Sensor histidine kinase n=1 Tax=Sinomonas puerhi TaxID=3238584 RepID=A0AB39L8W3_9MICC|nr:histidine kinase [Sinomonas sp. ASV486]MDQ4490437.1 histidine kinase [Sinomonas sp. ASV486]